MRLTDRDYKIFREVERWRYCLGRHIKFLVNFSGQRACDRRLRTLIDEGFLQRKKYVYGIPSVYALTYKSKILISANKAQEKIKLDNAVHDVTVLDTAIHLIQKWNLELDSIITEKQLHQIDGFSYRKHRPDFIIHKNSKTIAVEVELTLKAKNRFEDNIKSNFMEYDTQIWIVPDLNTKIARILQEQKISYPNIKILEINEVKKNV